VRPPAWAEKAISLPSGDQLGLNTSPRSGNASSRTMRPLPISITDSTGRLLATAEKAKRLPSGLNDPADWMNSRLS